MSFDALSIGFENGEVLTIPAEYVGVFYLEKTEKLAANGGYGDEHYSVEQVILCIDRSLSGYRNEKDAYWSDDEAIVGPDAGIRSYIERLQASCHISSIQIDTCTYIPAWLDNGKGCQCDNPYQQSKVNKHGDLFMIICADMELLDRLFPDEVINADDFRLPCFGRVYSLSSILPLV